MTDEIQAFQQFDAEDDRQIMAQIQGQNLDILNRMVYSYTDRRGSTITGLSLTGVRETVREMNRRGLTRIRVTSAPPMITETDDYIDAIVYAEDELNGGGSWGAKRQAKQVGNYPNPFALEQAISKAQRNAMFALIPAAYVVEMITEYQSAGRVGQIAPPAAPTRAPAKPPPPTVPSRNGSANKLEETFGPPMPAPVRCEAKDCPNKIYPTALFEYRGMKTNGADLVERSRVEFGRAFCMKHYFDAVDHRASKAAASSTGAAK